MQPAIVALLVLLLTGAGAAQDEQNLLTNPRFEQGLTGWTTNHGWYQAKVDGEPTGLSEVSVEPDAGRDGGPALKMVGAGNRGIVMQNFPIPGLRLKVSAWLKCEGLGDARADVLTEFMGAGNQWLSGVGLDGVTGTQDWTRLEKEIEVPAEAESIHLDLLTSAPNTGTTWWSDISMTPVIEEGAGPPKLTFTAEPAPGEEGAVLVKWSVDDPARLLRTWVFCEGEPFRQVGRLMPAAEAPRSKAEAAVGGLESGRTYHVAAVGLGGGGRYREEVQSVAVTPADLRPPVPPPAWLSPPLRGTGVLVHWRATYLDDDIAAYRAGVRRAGGQPQWTELKPDQFRHMVESPAGEEIEVAVTAADGSGNASEPEWLKAKGTAAPTETLGGLQAWCGYPTAQFFPDSERPGGAPSDLRLPGLRGQSISGQIALRSAEARSGLVAVAGPLRGPDGAQIAADRVRWNPIEYVHVTKQSTATPPEELVRQVPADFPDPLAEPGPLDLGADRTESLFVTIDIPRDAAAGRYEGAMAIVGAEGRHDVPVRLEVYPVELPADTRLLVTTWMNSNNLALAAEVEPGTEAHWRHIRAMLRDMQAHHQNVVMIGSGARCFQEEDGSFTFDWRGLDRWVREMDRCGVGKRIELGHLGGRGPGGWTAKEFRFHPRRARDRRTGRSVEIPMPVFVKALRDHLAERGWLERSMLHIADEPIPVNVESWKEHSRIVREAAPDLRRIDAIHVTDLAGDLEVWVPQLNYFWQAQEELRRAQREGNCELWFYVAWVPQGKFLNRLIDFETVKTRLMHWGNYLWDAVGYLHWGYNHSWQGDVNQQLAPGDAHLVWPGKYGPRSSLRWEAQRLGIEDYELFCLLEDAYRKAGREDPKEAVKELLRPVMRTPEDYAKDPAELEQVRERVIEELVKLGA